MIARRRLLRGMLGGAAVGLGLPLLEQMLNGNGSALAAGSALPVRYGLFFWGHGLPWTYRHSGTTDLISAGVQGHKLADFTDLYTPTTTGKNWAVPETLKPLAKHQAVINVVTGLEPKTLIPLSPAGQCDGHMRGIAVALTADQIRAEGFDQNTHIFALNRPTLDQIIAKHPQFYGTNPTYYRSLQLGMSEDTLHDFGTWTAVSHSGPDAINPPIRDPYKLFTQLFAAKSDPVEVSRKLSVIDAVSEDTRQLSLRLGSRDKARLDEHLTHLSEIQRRLNAVRPACVAPASPTGTYPDDSTVLAKMDIMSDILLAALRCDMTRVFSIAFTTGASLLEMNGAGVIGAAPGARQLHDAVHGGALDIITAFTRMNLTAYAILLDKLTSDRDVNGQTQLDRSLIFGTSEYGEGYTHSNKEHPVILAGSAGGALETGFHLREENGNVSRAHLTVLRALGLNFASYGFNGGETSSVLPFLKG